jgi:hypothetical protein
MNKQETDKLIQSVKNEAPRMINVDDESDVFVSEKAVINLINSMTTDTDPRLEVLGKVNQLLVEHGAFDNDDKLYYAFQDLCDIIESELRTKIKQEAEE